MEKGGKLFLSALQIWILLLGIFSFAFVVSQANFVSADDAVTVVPHKAAYQPVPGQTFYNIKLGEGADPTKVRWLRTEKGIAYGETLGGDPVSWEALSSDQIQNADITSDILSNQVAANSLGKKGTFNGQTISVSEAALNPQSIAGMTNAEGTALTDAGKTFFEENGVKNPLLQGTSGVIAGGSSYSYKVPLLGFEITNFFAGHLVEGLVWAGAVVGVIQLVGGLFDLDDTLTNSLSMAAFAGIMSGKVAYGLFGQATSGVSGSGGILSQTLTSTQAGLIGLGIGVAVFLATYKKTEIEAVNYQCMPFEPPLGGNDCEECNKDPFRPCSEYRCRSLGQACDLVNKGTEEESCVWVNRGDVNSPTITPSDEFLTAGHRYIDHETRPPSLGTKIIRDGVANGCLQAFTPLEFGFTNNEPAQCKIDLVHRDNYEAMTFYVGETNFYLYNHTQKMSLPSPDSLNAENIAAGTPELQNDGIYDLYVRCQDANGNFNVDEFVFNFCVDPSPDTTPPTVVDTSIVSGSPVTYQTQKTAVDFYINEPSECKWSIQDKTYEEMENTMACSNTVGEINARQLYTCSTELTGIVDRKDNLYYVRCKDLPSKPDNERNVNVQSYEFALRGSQPLDILTATPNAETITGSTSIVNVELKLETSNGADEGRAICYFSPTGEDGSYVSMFNTDSFEHKQLLALSEGNYDYYFRCVDAGGNSDETQTSFTIDVDTEAPSVTRAYKDLDALKIVTDEEATCVYSLNSCNYVFEEGLPLIHSNPSFRQRHYIPWKPNVAYYIKCADDYGNQPNPSECSIIATGTNTI